MSLSGAARILVVHLGGVSDRIFALPVVCALRDHWPQATIGWLMEPAAAEFFAGHPAVDEQLLAPPGWLTSPGDVVRLRRRLRQFGPEMTLDIQGTTRSAIAAWLSGAECRLGFAGGEGRELSRLFNNRRVLPAATHLIDRNLQLVQPLGIRPPTVRFGLPEDPLEARPLEQWLVQRQLVGRLALIQPGAGCQDKLWPEDRFAEVVRWLADEHELGVVVLWCGAAERAAAERICMAAHHRASIAPPTTLRQLAVLARRARILVGSDTGALHVAAAAGAACVGLFGPTSARRRGPYGPQHVCVEADGRGTRRSPWRSETHDPMPTIKVDEVRQACGTVLARQKLVLVLRGEAA